MRAYGLALGPSDSFLSSGALGGPGSLGRGVGLLSRPGGVLVLSGGPPPGFWLLHADTSSELEALRLLKEHGDVDPAVIDKILDDNARALYAL